MAETEISDSLRSEMDNQLFRTYTANYLYQRSLDFSIEMLSREEYLSQLYESINEEVRRRRREDRRSTLDAISPPGLENFDEVDHGMPPNWRNGSVGKRYDMWENTVRDEFNHKFLHARFIKDRLIRSANPEQLHRMFDKDLKTAFYAYKDRDFRMAVLYLDEVIERYGYSDIADIVFYRAESYYAVQFLDRARNDYQFVLEHVDDDRMKRNAMSKLLVIAGEKAVDLKREIDAERSGGERRGLTERWNQELENLLGLWGALQEIVASNGEIDNDDEEYWETADRTARYLLVNNRLDAAQQILDIIPPSLDGYAMAQLRAADCSLRLLELEDAEERYLSIIKKRINGRGLTKAIIGEARLKLGYIDFLLGDFDLAFVNFNAVKGSDELEEKGVINCCWALYKMGTYELAITLSREFIDDYPESHHFYEALCIIGFCQEGIGDPDFRESYTQVMSAIDDRRDYRDLNYERRVVINLNIEIQRLESLIFLGDREDLFDDYRQLKHHAAVLSEQIRVAEALKTSPILGEMLFEQREVYRLLTEQTELELQLMDGDSRKLIYRYEDTMDNLLDVAHQVDLAVQYHMEQQNLIQREEEQRFEEFRQDTARFKLEQEWLALERTLGTTRQYIASIEDAQGGIGNVNTELLSDLAGVELDLVGLQDRLLDMRYELSSVQDVDVVDSRLDHWSAFAYERYTYDGMKFEDPFLQQGRLESVEEYIGQVNLLLAEKRWVDPDTIIFPDHLMPTSESGVVVYYAPPIPMWTSQTSAFTVPEEEIFEEGSTPAEEIETIEPSSETIEPTSDEISSPEAVEPSSETIEPTSEEMTPPNTTGGIEPPPEESDDDNENE
ncbi:MAG: hypothetical protein P9M15_06470 [Candidatus Electryoneaceae bacterium]|nr:hypothetical protein [Candidatus Electryoneaceae bacterium]